MNLSLGIARWTIRLAALVLTVTLVSCSQSDQFESDRFVDAIVKAESSSQSEATYMPAMQVDYTVALMTPPVDEAKLSGAGLSGARLEGVLAAAPKDFTAAVAIVNDRGATIGWYLGRYALVSEGSVVKKKAGETVTVKLSYGGPIPNIVSLR